MAGSISHPRTLLGRALLWVLCAGAVSASALAQAPEVPRYKGAEPQPDAQASSPQFDANEILVLIRTSLLTLGDAISTGNFTVLRDLISPSVRDQNTAGQLSQIFSPLIAKKLNLSAVAILTPNITKGPSIDANGRLQVSGFYPGQQVQTNFDLAFERVERRWRLYGLSVNLSPEDKQKQVPPPAKKDAVPPKNNETGKP